MTAPLVIVAGATAKVLRDAGAEVAKVDYTSLTGLSEACAGGSPGRHDLYPPWQGMQYLRAMLSGRASWPVSSKIRSR